MIKTIFGPWIDYYDAYSKRIISTKQILGKPLNFSGNFVFPYEDGFRINQTFSIELGYTECKKFPSREEAKKIVDIYLLKLKCKFLTQEQFDKLQILL